MFANVAQILIFGNEMKNLFFLAMAQIGQSALNSAAIFSKKSLFEKRGKKALTLF